MSSYLDDIRFLDEKLSVLHIEHFDGKELCNGWNVPDSLLYNILPTIRVLNVIREWYDNPIYLNSTYRSPEYNKACGGKLHSLHLEFNALDFTVKDKHDLQKIYDEVLRLDTVPDLFTFLPKSKGNFGTEYYDNRFIHLDTRSTLNRKSPARWEG